MQLTVDGRAAFAATGGRPFDPAQPAVLFVHGAGMSHVVWGLQSRYFAHHGRSVLAVDLPGHSRTQGPALTSIDAIADWLARLLDAAGAKQAAVAGHSLGALAAMTLAARAPDRVRALALLGAAPRMPVHPELLAAAAANHHVALELIADWALGRRGTTGGNPAPGLWLHGAAIRLLEQAAPGVLAADLAACNAYAGGAAAAAAVRCPTLVLIGAEDRMTPARQGHALAAAITGAEAVELPDCGHMMTVEAPAATLAALKPWL